MDRRVGTIVVAFSLAKVDESNDLGDDDDKYYKGGALTSLFTATAVVVNQLMGEPPVLPSHFYAAMSSRSANAR